MAILVPLDFIIDESLVTLTQLPDLIYKLDMHGYNLKVDRERIEELKNKYRAIKLVNGEIKGSNKEERDACMSILLDNDLTYQQLSDEVKELDWHLNKHKLESARLERRYSNLRLRQEQITYAAHIFSTSPGPLVGDSK